MSPAADAKPPIFEIKARYSGEVRFSCELTAEIAGQSYGLRLGFAIKKALEARAYLAGANLAGANLAGANLAGANLTRAYLADAYLAGANLAGAYLADAYLADANLTGAYLARANLAGANLAGAYLARANLAGANLAGAYLADAKWRNGITIQRAPIFINGLHYRVIILDEHMHIGCELHRISEWRVFDNERIARMDGLIARKFWAKWKEPLLAMAAADGRGLAAVAPAEPEPASAEA